MTEPRQSVWSRFASFVAMLLTPRRSFAYRELERRNDELATRLRDSEAMVFRLYQYILVYHCHAAPIPVDKKAPVLPVTMLEGEAPAVLGKSYPGRTRRADLDAKYRDKMRKEHNDDTGQRTASQQRERVSSALRPVTEDDDGIADALQDAEEFVKRSQAS